MGRTVLCFLEYRDQQNLLQLVREIPWGQNITIMTKVKERQAREYYLGMTAQMGWSRNVLLHQIKANAHQRHRLAPKQHNFQETLPEVLADQAMKDVYALDFLGIILCGDRKRMEVEYSLKGIDKPMGVAEYTLTRELPDKFRDKLPKVEDLENRIMQELGKGE